MTACRHMNTQTRTDDDNNDISSSLPCAQRNQEEPLTEVQNEPEVSTDSTDQWSNAIESYGDSLSEIVEDLIVRLKQGEVKSEGWP